VAGKDEEYKPAHILANSLGVLPFLASAIFYIKRREGMGKEEWWW
jgi:hypothetical protein